MSAGEPGRITHPAPWCDWPVGTRLTKQRDSASFPSGAHKPVDRVAKDREGLVALVSRHQIGLGLEPVTRSPDVPRS